MLHRQRANVSTVNLLLCYVIKSLFHSGVATARPFTESALLICHCVANSKRLSSSDKCSQCIVLFRNEVILC